MKDDEGTNCGRAAGRNGGRATVTSRPYTANGWDYWPLAGDFTGDGADDILWYLPGTGQDYLWDYAAGGSYTSSPRRIDGSYWALVGSFGANATDDVLRYGQGTRPDNLWDFAPDGSHTSRSLRIDGHYNPTVLDIFDDGAGGDDVVVRGRDGGGPGLGLRGQHAPQLRAAREQSGSYWTVTGALSGDGHEDVL